MLLLPSTDQSAPKVAPPPGSREHEACRRYIMECVEAGENLQGGYIEEWQENARAFYAMASKGAVRKAPWQSDTRNPYVFEQIMTLLPRLVDPRPRFDFIPQTPGAGREQVRASEHTVDYYMWRDNFNVQQARLMLPTCIFGVGWMKTSWKFRQVDRLIAAKPHEILAPPYGPGLPPLREEKVTVDDRAIGTVCHPYDVLWDPQAVTMETADWVAHRVFMSHDQLRAKRRRKDPRTGRMIGLYENVDEVGESMRERDWQLPNEVPQHVEERRKKDQVEVIELWSRSRDRLYVIANRSIVLRDIRNPLLHADLPFSSAITQPDILKLVGISEVSMLTSLQQMLWLLENQKLDNTRLNMDTVLLIRDTVENFDELIIEPGARWPVMNPQGDVQPLQMPQPQLAATSDIESLRARLQAITGMTYLSGASGGNMGVDQNTATGIMSLQEESNRRVDFRLGLVRSLCYERHADQTLQLAQQFMTSPITHRPDGRHGEVVQIDPTLIAQKMWVRSTLLTDTLSKSIKSQNANTALAAIQPFLGTPLPNGKQLNPVPAFELLAQSMDTDLEEWMQDPPPVDPSAMAAMMGGQPPSGGATPSAPGEYPGAAVY